MNNNKISAFVVAYHEEGVIERCVQSLVGVVDEIIIIHDGPCKDRTIEISKKYTDKIFEMPVNKGIGESHYIFAFKQCKNNWILRIDADEYLSEDLRMNIGSLVKNNNISAFSFVWPIWDGEKYVSVNWPYKNFLFQKNKIGFLDKFHYPIKIYGEVRKEKMIVHHKPKYNNYTEEVFKNKILKWCKLQAVDHLVPVEEREMYNMDIEYLKNEQALKSKLYKYPVICFIITFLRNFSVIFREPFLIFQKGFWLGCMLLSRYTYNVALEVSRIINNK